MPSGEFDWLKSSNADRAILYEVFNGLLKTKRLARWDDLFKAVGLNLGADYTENFRRGKNSRRHCVLFAQQLRTQFPDAADLLERKLRREGQPDDWTQFFLQHRVDDRIAAISYTPFPLPSYQSPLRQYRFREEEAFVLQLNSDQAGYAACLRFTDDRWFMLDAGMSIEKGQQWLLRSHDFKPISPLEDHFERVFIDEPKPVPAEIGNNIFVAVTADERAIAELAARAPSSKYPIESFYLDSFPAILGTSTTPYSLAWTKVHVGGWKQSDEHLPLAYLAREITRLSEESNGD